MSTLAQRNRLRRGAGAIRIPRHFYYDHLRRSHFGVPTAWKGTKRHVWIDPADAALDALLKDARYIAGAGGSGFCKDPGYRPEHFGLRMSALATVNAIESFLDRGGA